MQPTVEIEKPSSQSEKPPEISWDIGTAYDFFISLHVLHEPERFGLRPSWAAGVRSRIPANERKFLEEIKSVLQFPIHWIYALKDIKDVTNALWAIRQIPIERRLPTLYFTEDADPEIRELFEKISAQHQWDEADLKLLKDTARKYNEKASTKELQTTLTWWSKAEEFGERILPALQAFNQNFFAEEEKRIVPYLDEALNRTQKMAENLPLAELLVEISQGVHFEAILRENKVVLVPVYWLTPFIIQVKAKPETRIICFGARPREESLIPGDQVPDSLLKALKAMADPTRLKIMRYLAEEPSTPSELAQRLRLRAPTVIHHLSELRLAGLVHVMIQEGGEKRYAPRLEAIAATYTNFQDFLRVGKS